VTMRAPEELRLSVALGAGYSALMEEYAPNGSITFGTRFGASKDWGLLVSASGSDTKRGADNIEPGYDDGELAELEMRDYTVERERYGLTADIDYRFSNRSNYYLRGLWTNYIDTEIRRAKNNVVEDGEIERSTRDRTQESFINSVTFGGENNLGESLVVDYHVMWNKSQEEAPDQVTAGFIQEDVRFRPNVDPGHINPDNIQAHPLNEDPAEFWFDEIETENKKAVEEDILGAVNFTKGFYRNAGYSGLWKFGAKARFKTKDQYYEDYAWEAEDDLNMVPFLDDWNSETPFFGGIYGTQIVPFHDPALMRDLLASGLLEGEKLLEAG